MKPTVLYMNNVWLGEPWGLYWSCQQEYDQGIIYKELSTLLVSNAISEHLTLVMGEHRWLPKAASMELFSHLTYSSSIWICLSSAAQLVSTPYSFTHFLYFWGKILKNFRSLCSPRHVTFYLAPEALGENVWILKKEENAIQH